HPDDGVGGYYVYYLDEDGNRFGNVVVGVRSLSNGNYLVQDPRWNDNRGAVTWGNGTARARGTVSDANSLVGSNPNDGVGSVQYGDFLITFLSNGNYVVRSPVWSGQRGAVTWGSGTVGVSGAVSDANSLVGSNPGDQVGYFGITALSNGNYLVVSAYCRLRALTF